MSVLFSGTKDTGKTYRAVHVWAPEQIGQTGYAMIAIDPRLVETLAHLPHAATVEETIDRAVGLGQHIAYQPKDEDEFDEIVAAVDAAGELVLLIDEVRIYVHARHVSAPMVELARVERNRKVRIAYTTQSYMDVRRELTCVLDDYVLFLHTADEDLEAIEKRFGKEVRDQVATLKKREFLQFHVGV